jgi:hypothetical protein
MSRIRNTGIYNIEILVLTGKTSIVTEYYYGLHRNEIKENLDRVNIYSKSQ